MLETISLQHCDETGALIFGELLRWADLATCAAAEAHTHTNCVTGEVTDLVLERGVVPRHGDILELIADPVIVGNTSLVIGLQVNIEKASGDCPIALCSAQFTYITMKDVNGNRPKCPPLERARLFEVERRSILAKKNKILNQLYSEFNINGQKELLASVPSDAVAISKTADWMVELVLPTHANHMHNTFGGQVMCWMHKAAAVTARRHAKRSSVDRHSPGVFWTIAVEGIRFLAPSKPSDHLFFNTSVRRVFSPNHMVIWVQVLVRSIEDASEEEINTALFHIMAFEDHVNGKPCNLKQVAPNPNDLSEVIEFHEIERRSQITSACASMVGFRSGIVPWLEDFAEECASTTVDTLLRMVEGVGLVPWRRVHLPNVSDINVDQCKGLFGQECTALKFVLECGVNVDDVFRLLKATNRRADWDMRCLEYSLLRQCTDTSDLVHYALRLPTVYENMPSCSDCVAGLLRNLDEWMSGSRKDMLLLRAWRDGAFGSKVIASRAVRHETFEHTTSKGWIASPSGFVMENIDGLTTLTYMVVIDDQLIRAFGGKRRGVQTIVSQQIESLRKLRQLFPATTRAKPRNSMKTRFSLPRSWT